MDVLNPYIPHIYHEPWQPQGMGRSTPWFCTDPATSQSTNLPFQQRNRPDCVTGPVTVTFYVLTAVAL